MGNLYKRLRKQLIYTGIAAAILASTGCMSAEYADLRKEFEEQKTTVNRLSQELSDSKQKEQELAARYSSLSQLSPTELEQALAQLRQVRAAYTNFHTTINQRLEGFQSDVRERTNESVIATQNIIDLEKTLNELYGAGDSEHPTRLFVIQQNQTRLLADVNRLVRNLREDRQYQNTSREFFDEMYQGTLKADGTRQDDGLVSSLGRYKSLLQQMKNATSPEQLSNTLNQLSQEQTSLRQHFDSIYRRRLQQQVTE